MNIEKVEYTANNVGLSDIRSEMDRAVASGGFAFRHDIEYSAIMGDGSSTHFVLLNDDVTWEANRGLKFDGVMRKTWTGLNIWFKPREFIDANPREVIVGDKVVYRVPDGEDVITNPVQSIERQGDLPKPKKGILTFLAKATRLLSPVNC